MKMLAFAVLFLCTGALAAAQQVTLLENDSGVPEKTSSSVAEDGMPQVTVPKAETLAAVPPVPAPAAVPAVSTPQKKTKKFISKSNKSSSVAVSSSAVKSLADAPAVSPVIAIVAPVPVTTATVEAVKPIVISTAPKEFNLEAAKPAEAVKPPTVTPTAVLPAEAVVKPAPVPAAPSLAVLPAPPALPGAGFSVGKTHTVTGGDTLWDLSNKYYKDPYRWGKIYNANLDSVKNPDRIYPKEELIIPELTEEIKPEAGKRPVITGGETVKEAEFTATDVAQAEGSAAPAAAPAAAAAASTAPAELNDILNQFDSDDFSKEMPVHQKEWSAGVKIVPESWQQDGVVAAAEKGENEQMENSLSETGDIILVSMSGQAAVKKGDYLSVYMKGATAYNKAGAKLGLELQQAGTLQVLTADGPRVRARVIEALTAIVKGYVVKKK